MKGRPLSFSDPMVIAILQNLKTETRRLVKPGNSRRDGYPWHPSRPFEAHDWANARVDPGPSPAGNPGPYLKVPYPDEETVHRVYPIWRPGDRLWVKEAWRIEFMQRTDAPHEWCGILPRYLADLSQGKWLDVNREWWEKTYLDGEYDRWRDAQFMPRWASRISLEVTSVGVERLEDITDEGAMREGFDTREEFLSYVRNLYKLSADDNPVVWVIGFDVVEVPK